MKKPFLFFIAFCSLGSLNAQVKVYFMAGTNFNSGLYIDGFYSAGKGNYVFHTDGKYKNNYFLRYFSADLLLDKRINKTIYGVTGLMVSQVGYKNSFGTNFSEYTCTYLGIPLMLRLNLSNGFLMDVGPVGRIPLVADLNETALKGSVYQVSDHQNIAKYLTPFSLGWAWQNTFMVNRYSFTFYFMGGKTLVSNNLEENWKINGGLKNNSLFLRDMQPKYVYQMMGIKLGIRLR